MSEEKLGFVGKQVKDIYGAYIGKVVGTVTEIDGTVETVAVDCGAGGLKQFPEEQLVMQGDYVFYIPKWRLDAQRLLRQKSLTLNRVKALQDIVADNDSMREDAELVYVKYERKLKELEETEKAVFEKLQARTLELDTEAKGIKAVLFDAKLQFRSNEIKEDAYEQVRLQTDELIEHINNEKTEIVNVKCKIANQTLENLIAAASAVAEQQSSPVSTEAPSPEPQERIAVAAAVGGHSENQDSSVSATPSTGSEATETSWLHEVIQK